MDRIGKYVVEGVLGRGAMGVVYKARDPEIDRVVAVKTLRKLLPAELSKTGSALGRFITEARSAGRLRHPHIITIFDINLDGEVPFIVMDYVEGDTLGSLISRYKRVPPEESLEFIKQAAKGLDYAHSQGVLHKDIKPGNLLIDQQNTLFILDFGIASIEETISKQSGDDVVMGTPGYMAPEQAMNVNVTFKVDLFSLGVVAFEMLAGSRPFSGSDFTTAVRSVVKERPKSITAVNPAIPVAVESVFERILSKAPEVRHDSATEFVEDLAAAFGKSLSFSSGSKWRDGENKPPQFDIQEETAEDLEADLNAIKEARFRRWTITAAMFCVLMIIFIGTLVISSGEEDSGLKATRAIDARAVIDAGLAQEIEISLPELSEVDLSKGVLEMSSNELLSLITHAEAPEDKIIGAISEGKERSIPYLFEALVKAKDHASYVVREKAIKVIGELEDDRGVSVLLESLDDYDTRVRLAAARALGDLGGAKVVNYLSVKVSRESSAAVKKALTETIEKISKRTRHS